MTKLDPRLYEGREQTYVKHYVLENYLERLAFKIGHAGATLNYIDGFAGPWDERDSRLTDTSPLIALRVLRGARDGLREQGKMLTVRALFIEKDPKRCARLENELASVKDVEHRCIAAEFEPSIPEIVRFACAGVRPFAFTFIDPLGWDGFGLHAIQPLLSVDPSEVLINFMTDRIRRFIGLPRKEFEEMFGDETFRERWKGLEARDREDAMVETYAGRILKAGHFRHAGAAVVLNPYSDRTHYHLVYATRKAIGLSVFREVERSALAEQDEKRALAQQRKRVSREGQQDLFEAQAMSRPYVDELRARYHSKSNEFVLARLRASGSMAYDEAFELALGVQMTSEQDLKDWIKELRTDGSLAVEGLSPSEKVPKYGQRHRLVLLKRP